MKVYITILLFCLGGSVAFAQPRGWKGIVPLHSKRADVERLLGAPTERLNKYSDFYRTSKETVIIDYTRGLRYGSGQSDAKWKVPRDTVEGILVSPTGPIRFSELGMDTSSYRKEEDQHRLDDIHYINDQAGEEIVVFMGDVRSLRYYPAAIDKHLLCPTLSSPAMYRRRR